MVVGDADDRQRHAAQGPHSPLHAGIRLHAQRMSAAGVSSSREMRARSRCLLPVIGMCVDAGANCAAAKPSSRRESLASSRARSSSQWPRRKPRTPGQADRYCILHVGAADFRMPSNSLAFSRKVMASVSRGPDRASRDQQGAEPHASGKDVMVTAVVDVVVGVHFRRLAKLATEDSLARLASTSLVFMWKETPAPAEHIDDELVVPLAFDHFLRGLNDGIGAPSQR